MGAAVKGIVVAIVVIMALAKATGKENAPPREVESWMRSFLVLYFPVSIESCSPAESNGRNSITEK